MPNVYVFASENLTNLWAGVGAGYWAVSAKQADNNSIRGKAKHLPVGSFGLFYCVEAKALTTPFIITSTPDERAVINHVWNDEWQLPFTIVPLATPRFVFPTEQLKLELPSLKANHENWNKLFHISPITAFAPSKIPDNDWSIIIERLLPKTSFTVSD